MIVGTGLGNSAARSQGRFKSSRWPDSHRTRPKRRTNRPNRDIQPVSHNSLPQHGAPASTEQLSTPWMTDAGSRSLTYNRSDCAFVLLQSNHDNASSFAPWEHNIELACCVTALVLSFGRIPGCSAVGRAQHLVRLRQIPRCRGNPAMRYNVTFAPFFSSSTTC